MKHNNKKLTFFIIFTNILCYLFAITIKEENDLTI